MKRILLGLLGTGLMLLAACATLPTEDIRVQTESDPGLNFAKYKTYAWLGSAGILNDPDGKWEPPAFDADAEITFLINRELRKRGLSETRSKPDLNIAYAVGVDMAALKVKTKPDSKIQALENVPQGALILVMVDRKTGYAIWGGAATAEIKNLGPEIAKKRLDYTITKMMQQIPR